MYTVGARLCRLDLRTREVTPILADERGGIRDPQVHYGGSRILIREMKRYGILRADYSLDEPIDIFALDQAYWKSFWHRPSETLAGH